MNNIVDRALNRVTMYQLMLYYAAGLTAIACVLGSFRILPQHPTSLAFSLVLIGFTCWATNRLFAAWLRVPVNSESVYITALLLALVMAPVTAGNLPGAAGLMVASIVAIASKFVLAVRGKHIFNPVAIGVAVSALALNQPPTWWVGGNEALLPFVLAGGLLVARKVQRFDMIGVYILANLAATLANTAPAMYGMALKATFLYSPLLFAGFAMLTEPLTAPHGRASRLAYGAIVGALSSPDIRIGGLYLTPEIAFLVGNLFAFAVSPKGRFKLTLLRIEKMASGCYDFVFKPDRRLAFRPGQFLDWTLDVPDPDGRGNRRSFTIASAPTEEEVRLGVKFHSNPSAFKRSLAAMSPGDAIYGSQIAGSFTLPRNPDEKLAFIAGGIGITPFRSMVHELINRREERPIVLLYGNNTLDEVAYKEVLERARRELGIRTVYAVAGNEATEPGIHKGFIDETLIRREIPDFLERTFYLSGPRGMVLRFEYVLKGLGVARSRIRVDFFPGYA
jgi:ferredoxin-NADP reductase